MAGPIFVSHSSKEKDEVVLTLGNLTGKLADLGLRLGAPMLVSSAVVILERLAQWLNQRAPSLRWSPTPSRDTSTPWER